MLILTNRYFMIRYSVLTSYSIDRFSQENRDADNIALARLEPGVESANTHLTHPAYESLGT